MHNLDLLSSQKGFAQVLLHLLVESFKLVDQFVHLVPIANWIRHIELLIIVVLGNQLKRTIFSEIVWEKVLSEPSLAFWISLTE